MYYKNKYKCPSCNKNVDETIRIRIEIVDKKTKAISEVIYGEILCFYCFNLRYKGRTKVRVYI